MLALTALVLSLNPVQPAVDATLAQAKVQIIKGKRGTVKAANAGGETTSQTVQQQDTSGARAKQLDQKEAQVAAKEAQLAEQEQAFDEKQAAASEQEKKKADQQKKQREQIERMGRANERAWSDAVNELAGE